MHANGEGPGQAAARLTGRAVAREQQLSPNLAEVVLAGGHVVVVKRGCGANAVPAEAAGLRWLADSGAVPVPVLHGHDEDWLVLDRVSTMTPSAAAAEQLGRELAAMHAAGAPAYGAPPPGGPVDAWIGRTTMVNLPRPSWPEWYVEYRLLPYLRHAVDDGLLAAGEVTLVERVCARLTELAPPAPPPARLHGDLWHGNVLWGVDGRAWLIDPAAHGGHPETDLAMLHLFGCAQLDRILAGYQETTPLAEGWSDRIALHQLYPLLVHVVLFGRSYVERTVTAARAALR